MSTVSSGAPADVPRSACCACTNVIVGEEVAAAHEIDARFEQEDGDDGACERSNGIAPRAQQLQSRDREPCRECSDEQQRGPERARFGPQPQHDGQRDARDRAESEHDRDRAVAPLPRARPSAAIAPVPGAIQSATSSSASAGNAGNRYRECLALVTWSNTKTTPNQVSGKRSAAPDAPRSSGRQANASAGRSRDQGARRSGRFIR